MVSMSFLRVCSGCTLSHAGLGRIKYSSSAVCPAHTHTHTQLREASLAGSMPNTL